MIYFHTAQVKPSFLGGQIAGCRVEKSGEWKGRIVFRFRQEPLARGVKTGKDGWAMEMKIVPCGEWKGAVPAISHVGRVGSPNLTFTADFRRNLRKRSRCWERSGLGAVLRVGGAKAMVPNDDQNPSPDGECELHRYPPPSFGKRPRVVPPNASTMRRKFPRRDEFINVKGLGIATLFALDQGRSQRSHFGFLVLQQA